MFNKKSLLLILGAVLLLLPHAIVLGAGSGAAPKDLEYVTKIPYWGQYPDPLLLPCTGLECTSACDFVIFAEHLIMFLITLGIFALAPLMIAIGGILIMVGGSSTIPGVAGGSATQVSTGKKMITGTVIGIVFCLIAWLIIATLVNVLGVSGTAPGSVGGFGNAITCDQPTLTLPSP